MEAILARVYALVGNGCRRPMNRYFEASASPGRRSTMPRQLRHLHRRPEQSENPPEGQHRQNNNGRAPSSPADIPEENWSMQHNNVTTENSADPAGDPIRDTVEGSFGDRVATLKSIGRDRVCEYKLELLLKKKPAPICYVWCDPFRRMHISQGIIKTMYINKMVKSGCKVKILMADWFAQLNRQIVGNPNKIRNIGLYNIEMWKAAGMAFDGVELVWLSDEISRHADTYWPLVMDIARKNTVTELARSHRIRHPMKGLTADDIFNPCLQCASMLFQKVDIWLLSMDLHDAASLASHYCNLKRKNKPVAVLHNMPPNLLQYPEKEIIKHPGSAIFMEDDEEVISRKIEYAFCPPKVVKDNPCLGYIRYVILPWFGKFDVIRKKENGGNNCFIQSVPSLLNEAFTTKIHSPENLRIMTFLSMEELAADYVSGSLHPSDVKLALVKSLNEILQPVRVHFESSSEAKAAVKAIKEC